MESGLEKLTWVQVTSPVLSCILNKSCNYNNGNSLIQFVITCDMPGIALGSFTLVTSSNPPRKHGCYGGMQPLLHMRGKSQPAWIQALVVSFTEQIISLYLQYLSNRIKGFSPLSGSCLFWDRASCPAWPWTLNLSPNHLHLPSARITDKQVSQLACVVLGSVHARQTSDHLSRLRTQRENKLVSLTGGGSSVEAKSWIDYPRALCLPPYSFQPSMEQYKEVTSRDVQRTRHSNKPWASTRETGFLLYYVYLTDLANPSTCLDLSGTRFCHLQQLLFPRSGLAGHAQDHLGTWPAQIWTCGCV